MILVDSSVWINYFNNYRSAETDLLDRLIGHERILIGDLILAEVLQGFRSDLSFDRVRHELEAFDCPTIGGRAIAIAAAQNFRTLRNHGVTVRKTIDTLIASFCIAEGHQLLHRDRDFDLFERYLGLRVVREGVS